MIKIGIIDSGIQQTAAEQSNISGIFLKKDAVTHQINAFDNIEDQIGHGSECFKIISSMVTDAIYYIVKIFDDEMISDVDVLAAAIKACIVQEVNIINISAGVKAEQVPELLRVVFDEAYDHNISILSANHNSGCHCYPAHYTKVIGVGFTELTAGEPYMFRANENIEFYTSAADLYAGEVVWSNATSFACAKMTAFAANMLAAKGKMNMEELKAKLVNHIQTK